MNVIDSSIASAFQSNKSTLFHLSYDVCFNYLYTIRYNIFMLK